MFAVANIADDIKKRGNVGVKSSRIKTAIPPKIARVVKAIAGMSKYQLKNTVMQKITK